MKLSEILKSLKEGPDFSKFKKDIDFDKKSNVPATKKEPYSPSKFANSNWPKKDNSTSQNNNSQSTSEPNFSKFKTDPKLKSNPVGIPSLSQLTKDLDVDKDKEPKKTTKSTSKKTSSKKEPYSPSKFANPDWIPKAEPEKQKVTYHNDKLPSLKQLTKDLDSEPEEKPDTRDPVLHGLPNFDDKESEEEPDFGTPDLRTPLQRKAADVKQGIKKGAQVIGKGIKKGFDYLNQKPDTLPKSWKFGAASDEPSPESQEGDKDSDKMPSMTSMAKPKSSLPQGKHWQWKPGQKVDIGWVKDLTVLKTDMHGSVLKSKNGGIYRFIPHRGLRKIG